MSSFQITTKPLDGTPIRNPAGPMVVPDTIHKVDSRLTQLEKMMMQFPPANCPVEHHFTPGLYCREIFMPAGSVIISKIHKTEHQYTVSQGRASVWIEGEGWMEIAAPFHGITKPGTKRVLVIHEDCIWITSHPTALTDVDAIEAEIIQPHNDHTVGMEQHLADAIVTLKEGDASCHG